MYMCRHVCLKTNMASSCFHVIYFFIFRRDSEQLAKFQAFKDSASCIPLNQDCLPSICFYTLLNTNNRLHEYIRLYTHTVFITHLFFLLLFSLNSLTLSQDSALLAGGFADSTIKLWSLTPKKLHPLKSTSQMQHITLSSGGWRQNGV